MAVVPGSSGAILCCEKLTKAFGGLVAVKGVDMCIMPGERRSVIGPNGAGKTTLFNVINGELKATSGKVFIRGKDVTHLPTHTRVKYGLARTFQVTNLFPESTLHENVVLALLGYRSAKFVCWRPLGSYNELHGMADDLLDRFSLGDLREERVANLSYGDQRLLEVVLGMAANPSILALDEPSSGLSGKETEKLVEVLNALDRSIALLVIEHDMRVAFEVTDKMTVMYEGEVIADGPIDEVKNSPRVQEVYLGTRTKEVHPSTGSRQ